MVGLMVTTGQEASRTTFWQTLPKIDRLCDPQLQASCRQGDQSL
jgi:hypothetical protein